MSIKLFIFTRIEMVHSVSLPCSLTTSYPMLWMWDAASQAEQIRDRHLRLPVEQWDRQAFLGIFLTLLADRFARACEECSLRLGTAVKACYP